MTKKKAAKSVTDPQPHPPKRAKDTVRVAGDPASGPISAGPKSGHIEAEAKGETELANDRPGATLKERVEQVLNRGEPLPTAAESEAIRFAVSIPGLLDEVREQAFVALAAVVERKLAEHERHLTQAEAANVAWWIVSHPDDVPDA